MNRHTIMDLSESIPTGNREIERFAQAFIKRDGYLFIMLDVSRGISNIIRVIVHKRTDISIRDDIIVVSIHCVNIINSIVLVRGQARIHSLEERLKRLNASGLGKIGRKEREGMEKGLGEAAGQKKGKSEKNLSPSSLRK